MPSEAQVAPEIKSKFSRLIASLLAAVLALAGLVTVAPGAYAATQGITVSTLHNGNPVSDGAVVEAGDTFTLRVLYDNNLETPTVVVGPPEGLTFDESSLDVTGNDAIESITFLDGNIQLNFVDPAEWDVNQGVWDLDFTIDAVDVPEIQTIEWTVDGTPNSVTVTVTTEDSEQENVSNQLAKGVQDLNLNQYVSVNQGTVELDDAILEQTFEYSLTVNTDRDTDRSGFTIEDQLSEYLTYNEDSFQGSITTWDDIGWNSTTDAFDFNPAVDGNSFTYSGDIPNPSELTVTYTAAIAAGQLDALTAALQTQYNELNGPGDFTVGLNNTVTFGDDTTDEANVNITGNRSADDEPHEVTDFLDKTAGNTNLDGYVSFDQSGQVILDDAIANHDITYTLTVNTASEDGRNGFTFADRLSRYLEYDQDSFSAEITTWDEDGWTSETNDFEFTPEFSGNGFTLTDDIPGRSELTITYTASVASDQVDALRDALQTEFDRLGVDSGEYRVSLDNTVTFGGDDKRTANVSVGNTRGTDEGPENVSNRLDKGVGNIDLSQFVDVYEGEVRVDEDILDERIRYALVVNTDRETQRPGYTIEDEISEFLTYDQDSFEANITTWDENGWNQTTDPFEYDIEFGSNGFTITGDIVGPSALTINYEAYVGADQLEALKAALQERFDALEQGWGSFSMELPNTATFGGDTERDDSVTISGHLPEPPVPAVGDAFDKNSNIESINITPAEDGTLEPPLDVTYTFDVDLTQWDGNAADGYLNDEDFTLDRNVVISDSLPEQAQWHIEAEDFISGMDLTEATGFDGDGAAFAADEYVGQYAVVGQDLFINVGTDNSTDAEIAVKAVINTIDGLTGTDDGGIERFALENDATFTFSDDEEPYKSSVTITLNDRGDGIADESKFSKTALNNDEPVSVRPGESATVEYRFTANQDQSDAVDMTESYIVDYRDPNIFDFEDLDQTVESINGTLGTLELEASHFDLNVNDEGNLVIAINDDGEALIDEQGVDPTSPFVLDLALNTVPFTGKQTRSIENNATLYGSRDEALFVSGTSSEATSYGNEAEVRKTIRDTPNQEWTQNLRAEVNEDGNLVQDQYVYNLAFIPHGNYAGVPISAVLDELPEQLEFIGFVTDDNVDTHENPVDGPIDIGGNLEAVYEDGVVRVQQKDGTLLVQEPNISANVLVRVVDFEENVPVVNFFGNSSSTYTPSDGYPLSITKVDSEDDEAVINDLDARFTVYDEDDNVVIDNAFVENGQLRVLDEDGEVSALVVQEPGTYYVEENVAPYGYIQSDERITVVVNENGSSDPVQFLNDPAPTYAIGDYVWIDANRDGIQDDDEDPLAGVTVILEDAATGNELDRTETDDAGRYIFDDLLADDYRVRFILTDEQAAQYAFTEYRAPEADVENDSNAGSSGYTQRITLGSDNPNLVPSGDYEYGDVSASEGIDPTWDAGVILADFAIGDYVWIDENRDGIQDSDEPALEGVTVVLYDGEGNELDSTTTDENGRYLFDNLPRGEYQVGFELTEEQQELYEFTAYNSGNDGRWDSDAGENNRSRVFTLDEDNSQLVRDYREQEVSAYYGIDPTWDAGVVRIEYAIGDYVWIDENGNGIQDEEDTPLEDVTVVLYDGEGEKLDSTTTGADGRYIFDNLPTGEYQVGFELNEEQARQYFFTTYTEGDDAAEDSDAGENNRSAVFTLGDDSPLVDDENYDYNTVEASEGIDPTWDAGVVEFLPTVEIIKGDGDAEEGTIENDANTEDDAVAYDYDETREIVIQVTNTGNEDLVNVVLTDETQSGADIENLEWTLPNGETIEATANDDGVLTATWDGPWSVGETITGTATLTLPVSEDLHTNIASVTAEGATSGESVEDDDPYNGTPPPPPEIGVDKNEPGDDVHQVEAGAHDVTVTITNNGEEALENFEFTDTTEEGQDVVWNEDDLAGLEDLVLEVGDHFTVNGTVQVAAGETHRDNVVVNADGVISGEEVDDEDPTTYEADPTYAIGDYVWIDENGNGIQDEGETPLEDVTVVLYDGEGNELDRTVTDEHGRYLFDELPAGDYEVGFELTEEQAELYEFTGLTQGDDPAQDSNAGERGRTGVFTLGPDSPLVSDEDYEYASVSASEGIDPTWDAGVVLIPEDAETPPPADPTVPADPADPTDPADPAGPGSDTPEGDDEGPGGTLSMTGAHLALLLTAAGLILLVIGGLLYARHRKGINA